MDPERENRGVVRHQAAGTHQGNVHRDEQKGEDEGGPSHARFVQFREISPEKHPEGALSLEGLHDVPLTVRVEIGRTDLSADELVQLTEGEVIKLEKMAGEPIDLFLRDTHFARGEVTVVDGAFRFRVTDVITDGPTSAAETE